MTTRGSSPVPDALGSASTETEENRAFFQDRLRLYTGWVFVLAFGFYLLSAANAPAIPFNFLVEPTSTFHELACVTVGVVWIMMGRRAAISTPWSLDPANELWTEAYAGHVETGRPTPADSLPTLAIDISDWISSVGSP